MRNELFFLFVCAGIVSMSACSMETLKRTGYEVMQDIGEQQCERELSSECAPRESYDVYQKKLEDDEHSK
ncbi:hypothetical protein [Nitrosomonas sp.]|uniref:hypothetical protein n=1 Tax=Nitrosomonas sp. TaxID=42353 RepID=UPI002085191C|nr:hypothetical protein [Nitrosomonas sp.]GJL74937.1 MAG: hypothetical protein NMNS02_10430 [Nitrosomonas sp.]